MHTIAFTVSCLLLVVCGLVNAIDDGDTALRYIGSLLSEGRNRDSSMYSHDKRHSGIQHKPIEPSANDDNKDDSSASHAQNIYNYVNWPLMRGKSSSGGDGGAYSRPVFVISENVADENESGAGVDSRLTPEKVDYNKYMALRVDDLRRRQLAAIKAANHDQRPGRSDKDAGNAAYNEYLTLDDGRRETADDNDENNQIRNTLHNIQSYIMAKRTEDEKPKVEGGFGDKNDEGAVEVEFDLLSDGRAGDQVNDSDTSTVAPAKKSRAEVALLVAEPVTGAPATSDAGSNDENCDDSEDSDESDESDDVDVDDDTVTPPYERSKKAEEGRVEAILASAVDTAVNAVEKAMSSGSGSSEVQVESSTAVTDSVNLKELKESVGESQKILDAEIMSTLDRLNVIIPVLEAAKTMKDAAENTENVTENPEDATENAEDAADDKSSLPSQNGNTVVVVGGRDRIKGVLEALAAVESSASSGVRTDSKPAAGAEDKSMEAKRLNEFQQYLDVRKGLANDQLQDTLTRMKSTLTNVVEEDSKDDGDNNDNNDVEQPGEREVADYGRRPRPNDSGKNAAAAVNGFPELFPANSFLPWFGAIRD